MATMAREAWTDERLDDLKASVDAGFQANGEEFRALRRDVRETADGLRAETSSVRAEVGSVRERIEDEFKAVRGEMRDEFKAVRGEIAGVRSELGALTRSLHQLTFAMVGTVFLGFMGTIAALFSVAH